MHRLFDLRVSIILSRGNALKWVQAYKGCFSVLHTTQWLLAADTLEVCEVDLKGGCFLVSVCLLCSDEVDSEACALRFRNS